MEDASGNREISDALIDQVLALLKSGQKLQAVVLLRGSLNLGLREAKEIVDRLQAERTPAASMDATADWQSEALVLLAEGKMLPAVKLCRERTNCGLREAKEQVDKLAADHGLAAQAKGCAGVIMLLATFLVGAGVASWFAML